MLWYVYTVIKTHMTDIRKYLDPHSELAWATIDGRVVATLEDTQQRVHKTLPELSFDLSAWRDFITQQLIKRRSAMTQVFYHFDHGWRNELVAAIHEFTELMSTEASYIDTLCGDLKATREAFSELKVRDPDYWRYGKIAGISLDEVLVDNPERLKALYNEIYSPLISELTRFAESIRVQKYGIDITSKRVFREIFPTHLSHGKKRDLQSAIDDTTNGLQSLIDIDWSILNPEEQKKFWWKLAGVLWLSTLVAGGLYLQSDGSVDSVLKLYMMMTISLPSWIFAGQRYIAERDKSKVREFFQVDWV